MQVLFVLIAAATAAAQVGSTPTGQALIGECWKGHSHIQMSDCVAGKAAALRAALNDVEHQLHESIVKQRNAHLEALFQSTVNSYRRYRTQQCHLQEVLASAGNGAADIKIACEAALDAGRIEQLKVGLWWQQPGA